MTMLATTELTALQIPSHPMNGVNEEVTTSPQVIAAELDQIPSSGLLSPEEKDTQVTCDVLCSLSVAYPQQPTLAVTATAETPAVNNTMPTPEKRKSKTCPKQLQLPMFLSKTYHMIDRCDPEIATWSKTGDNFVVKNVETFASHVLPLYFKHSNFSSFARQLNFYGFRKLRSDPILTNDVDPRTACYVRFYHDKFQKDRPELLHQIKRATKSEQQSKDEVESLKSEVTKLKESISQLNSRVHTLSTDYDKLAALITEILTRQQQHLCVQQEQLPQQGSPLNAPDLMHSLSQVAALSLQNQLRPLISEKKSEGVVAGVKRGVPEDHEHISSNRQKTT